MSHLTPPAATPTPVPLNPFEVLAKNRFTEDDSPTGPYPYSTAYHPLGACTPQYIMNYLIFLGGFLVNDSRSLESLGNPILKVLATIFSLPPPISL